MIKCSPETFEVTEEVDANGSGNTDAQIINSTSYTNGSSAPLAQDTQRSNSNKKSKKKNKSQNKTGDKSKDNKSKDKERDKKHRCYLCNLYFPSSEIERHLEEHSYECNRCGKICHHKNQYRLHMRLHSQMDKRNRITGCKPRKGKTLGVPENLEIVCNDIDFDVVSEPDTKVANVLATTQPGNPIRTAPMEDIIEIDDSEDDIVLAKLIPMCRKCQRTIEETSQKQFGLCQSCSANGNNSLTNSDDGDDVLVIDENV
ncbi:hypothetical protein Trydic_g196 [Trypoxylus dichotomus]